MITEYLQVTIIWAKFPLPKLKNGSTFWCTFILQGKVTAYVELSLVNPPLKTAILFLKWGFWVVGNFLRLLAKAQKLSFSVFFFTANWFHHLYVFLELIFYFV
jgi:hypothetical protein